MHDINRLPRYVQQTEALVKQYPRLPDALGELEATLCSKPDIYPGVIGTEIYRVKIVPYPGMPSLSVYFTYNAKTVILLSAEIVDAEE